MGRIACFISAATFMLTAGRSLADQDRIAFATDRDGDAEIYVMDADGANPVNLSPTPPTTTGPRLKVCRSVDDGITPHCWSRSTPVPTRGDGDRVIQANVYLVAPS